MVFLALVKNFSTFASKSEDEDEDSFRPLWAPLLLLSEDDEADSDWFYL